MSMTDDIRAALKSAPGPLTAAEIGEQIGQGGGEVSKILWSLAKAGEVDKQEVDGGRAYYVRNPKFISKRQAKAELAVDKPSRTKKPRNTAKPKKQAKAKQPRKKKAEADLPAPTSKPKRTSTNGVDVVSLRRSTLRTLIAHAMASDHPLDPTTRQAVIDATQEAA
jgi:DNA-binding transcriptional regulator GbsR (MarR family)